MSEGAQVLVVEDEENVGLTLCERLRQEGMRVDWARSVAEARVRIATSALNLAILDIGLPDGEGYEIAQLLSQEQPRCSVLFLTALGDPENRIKGLEFGAQDYMVKPFHFRELMLRIRNILKRSTQLPDEPDLELGCARINFASYEVESRGELQSLTQKEWALLRFLVERRGRVVSRDEILNFVWSEEEYPSPRTIDNFIVRLRRMIEVNPEQPKIISSVRGVGYQLSGAEING